MAQETASTVENRFVSMALQGTLIGAEALFKEADTGSKTREITELYTRFRSRFVDRSEDLSPGTGDALADGIVAAYRKYWIRTLMGELSFLDGEKELEASLGRFIGLPSQGVPNDVFVLLGSVLRDRGFYVLDTPAPPLRDLFLWKKEESKKYTVRLTDRSQRVQVTFISEISSLGWKDFATLGLASTTGWVEDGRLYCIDSAYDRVSENFQVSYLKHESRHLADYQHFPGLSSEHLEYRAKLTELAFASLTLSGLLNDFTARSEPNPDSPHAMANYRVTRELYEALYDMPLPVSGTPWNGVSRSKVSGAARRLLQDDSERLMISKLPD